MSSPFVHYDAKTLTEHNRKVLALLDHGPQSSLDEARADRADDHTPCADANPPLPRSALVPTLVDAGGSTRVHQHRDPDLPQAA